MVTVGIVIHTIFANTLEIEMPLMYLVVIYEAPGEYGTAQMNINDLTAAFTFEMCMWNDIRLVSHFAFFDR